MTFQNPLRPSEGDTRATPSDEPKRRFQASERCSAASRSASFCWSAAIAAWMASGLRVCDCMYVPAVRPFGRVISGVGVGVAVGKGVAVGGAVALGVRVGVLVTTTKIVPEL